MIHRYVLLLSAQFRVASASGPGAAARLGYRQSLLSSVPGTDEWGIPLTACRPSNSVIGRFIGRVECCGTVLKSPLLVDAAVAAVA